MRLLFRSIQTSTRTDYRQLYFERSCRLNLCLRQPPTLRGLASYTVFHFTFHFNQFTLPCITLYKQYQHAVNSNIVPNQKFIPHTYPVLKL